MIDDISHTTITDCLSWSETIKDQCADDLSLIRNLIADKKELYTSVLGTDNHKLSDLKENPAGFRL